MLYPKKVKFRKWQNGRSGVIRRNHADNRGTTLAFGSYGLKAMTHARVRSNQIESARRVIARWLGKTGRTWVRIFPDRPWTQKGAEVGMGKGKGDVQGYEFEVLPGRVLFEIDGVPKAQAYDALREAGGKLPLRTRIISRSV